MTDNISDAVYPKHCPIHNVATVITKSGSATLCPRADCDFVIQHPTVKQQEVQMKSKEIPVNADSKTRTAAIAEAMAAKKKAKAIDARVENGEAGDPPKGSKAEKKVNATKDGVVKPSKPERKTKIPRELNETREDDTDTTTEGDVKEYAAKKKADKELDKGVADAKKPKRKEKDPDMLSVSDVAREVGIDPKRARAKLRGIGKSASENEGRYSLVKRGSKEHHALRDLLTPEAEEAPEDEVEEEDEE